MTTPAISTGQARLSACLVLTLAMGELLPSVALAQSVGTITGRVRLTATPPANPVVRMGADPACRALYPDLPPVHEFVRRDADGGLADVLVEVRGAVGPGAPPSTAVVLDQRGCQFQPRVVAIQRGQRLEIRNGDPTMHNAHAVSTAGNDFDVSQVVGRPPFGVVLAHAERLMRIACNVHTWMNVYVAVVDHPFVATTGRDGRFVIAGVPAGTRQVHVWHERYGPLTATVDVPAGGSVGAEFAYAGTERAAPPAPADVAPHHGEGK